MDKRRKKSKESIPIGNILTDVIKTLRPEAAGGLIQVWQLWDEVVGQAIAGNARPAAFKGNLLLVHVSSSPWIHQLQFLKKEIIHKLNTALKQELIQDIKFKIGPV